MNTWVVLCALVAATMWPAIRLRLHEFSAVEMAETVIRGVRTGRPSNIYNSRALRCVNIKQANNKALSKVIDLEKNLNFRPYTYSSRGVSALQFLANMDKIYLRRLPFGLESWHPLFYHQNLNLNKVR